MTEELMYPSSAIADICKRKREKVLDDLKELAEHYYRQYLDGDPYLEKRDFERMIDELRSNQEQP